MLELHVDTRELAAIARPLSAMRGQLEKAVQAAVRRTGVTLRTDVIRQTAQVTYLQRAKITTAVFKPLVRTTASEIRAEIGVRGKPFGMDAFRLIPKRVTARRGRRSRDWPLSGYSTGPGEGIRTLPARAEGWSCCGAPPAEGWSGFTGIPCNISRHSAPCMILWSAGRGKCSRNGCAMKCVTGWRNDEHLSVAAGYPQSSDARA